VVQRSDPVPDVDPEPPPGGRAGGRAVAVGIATDRVVPGVGEEDPADRRARDVQSAGHAQAGVLGEFHDHAWFHGQRNPGVNSNARRHKIRACRRRPDRIGGYRTADPGGRGCRCRE